VNNQAIGVNPNALPRNDTVSCMVSQMCLLCLGVREMGLVQLAVKLASHHWEILGQSSLVFPVNKFISPLTSNTC
jgi:hypothetical protein